MIKSGVKIEVRQKQNGDNIWYFVSFIGWISSSKWVNSLHLWSLAPWSLPSSIRELMTTCILSYLYIYLQGNKAISFERYVITPPSDKWTNQDAISFLLWTVMAQSLEIITFVDDALSIASVSVFICVKWSRKYLLSFLSTLFRTQVVPPCMNWFYIMIILKIIRFLFVRNAWHFYSC